MINSINSGMALAAQVSTGMTPSDYAGVFLTVLSVLGGYKGISSLWSSYTLSKTAKADIEAKTAKTGPEVAIAVAQGAETAVLLMQQALETAERQITSLTKQVETLEAARARDQKVVESMSQRLGTAEEQVNAANAEIATLHRELAAYAADRRSGR